MSGILTEWRPDDPVFWRDQGRWIAGRNLWISIPALMLAFAVWMVWSVVAVQLPAAGFAFTTNQLFWLTALPGLSGATLRIFYSFMVPVFGGHVWTTLSTASLLVPAIGIGIAVQHPETPYWVFLGLALLAGLGGGNFASSMANISFFFPRSQKGHALALNAGLGNLGVSLAQLAVPAIIAIELFAPLAGPPQGPQGQSIWLQNAGYVWVPFIVAAAVAAWFGMNTIAGVRASVREQVVVIRRSHTWIMAWLYTGTFGSFIGFAAAFPLLAQTEFPDANLVRFAFVGPFVGALTRAGSGGLADRFGGTRLTVAVFVGMGAGIGAVLYALAVKDQAGAAWIFLAAFLVLFAVSGVGNASTFQMIPAIIRQERRQTLAGSGLGEDEIRRQAERESAATIGFTSAIAAYGAFFVPKSFGTSIALVGTPAPALLTFLAFYGASLVLIWWAYLRAGAAVRPDDA